MDEARAATAAALKGPSTVAARLTAVSREKGNWSEREGGERKREREREKEHVLASHRPLIRVVFGVDECKHAWTTRWRTEAMLAVGQLLKGAQQV